MIWAGFGPIGNTEKKKFGPIMSKFFLPPKTWKNRFQVGLNSQSIVYCSIEDTSLRDFYIMTLLESANDFVQKHSGFVVRP